jgi:hypothetical protein
MVSELVFKVLIVTVVLGSMGTMVSYVSATYGMDTGTAFAFLGALAFSSILMGASGPRQS